MPTGEGLVKGRLDGERSHGMTGEPCRPELPMNFFRLLIAGLLACALCGCQSLKDDPIMGDHPWQPGTQQAPNR
jgi:hypothetical protein